MKVALLHDEVPPGARPDEQDVLVQARAIGRALRRLGHRFVRLAFTPDLRRLGAALRRHQVDVVFNLVESVCGQGRLVHLATALLDSLGLPYTGAPTEAMFLTSSKVLAKRLMLAQGIPTPPWWAGRVAPEGAGVAGHRQVIKSVWEEASLGLDDHAVVLAPDEPALAAEVAARAARLGGEAFAERYIDGREFNLSVLGSPAGPQVLPPAEIHFVDYPAGRPRLVDYRAKWDAGSFEYHHTPRCFDFADADRPLLGQLSGLASACWALFGLRGYARVDFRVDEAGQPWVLEINANPCLSPDAGFPAAAARAGLDLEQVVARVLGDARAGPGRGDQVS